MGEAVLRHVAKERGVDLEVDSAGTAAYHTGEEPDERTVATCRKYNVAINHEARQVTQEDFRKFDYILASDEANLRNLNNMKPRNATATVKLFGSFDDNRPIGDPYYGGISGFEQCYRQCVRYSNKFLDEVVGKEDSSASNL
ncbi:hypothetical protein QCA50_001978 [Cerrena zonata]|uniref:Phosphotyrosine protein phosphatase I domain-containing protein n=1 Tax=Cerrena zonata TaxID=2478898 RepID=A0AAW0GUD1_9APHY